MHNNCSIKLVLNFFILFLLFGCSGDDDWLINYKSIISGIELGREIVIPIKNPNGLAFDGKYLWVADYNQKKPGEIIAIDPATHEMVRSAVVLPHMEGLAWDGKDFWVGSPARKISRLDGRTLRVVETFDTPTGEDADGLAWDGSRLWIASHFHGRGGAKVVRIDVNTKKVLKEFKLPFKEIGDIAYLNEHIWAVKFCLPDAPKAQSYIVKIDPDSGKIINLFYDAKLPRQIWGLTEMGNRLWVNNGGEKNVPPKLIELMTDHL